MRRFPLMGLEELCAVAALVLAARHLPLIRTHVRPRFECAGFPSPRTLLDG